MPAYFIQGLGESISITSRNERRSSSASEIPRRFASRFAAVYSSLAKLIWVRIMITLYIKMLSITTLLETGYTLKPRTIPEPEGWILLHFGRRSRCGLWDDAIQIISGQVALDHSFSVTYSNSWSIIFDCPYPVINRDVAIPERRVVRRRSRRQIRSNAQL